MLYRAMRCHALSDDIEVLQMDEVELRDPLPHEVQVEIKACAVNFPDILMIQGGYQFKPELPFAPGGEFSGVVTKVGALTEDIQPGDRVVIGNRVGGFAEYINVDAASVRPIPDGVTFAKAAGYATAYLTAYVALAVRGQLQPGETLLVHGAAGGVGMAAVDLGKQMGATVIATAGSDEKLARVQARGADHIINYSLESGELGGFRETVKAFTDGRGADVIYDPVGGSVFDESMRCINWGGRILTIGFTSGVWPKAAVNHILIKQISVIGVRAGEIGRRDPALGERCRQAVYDLLKDGQIDPYVCAHFPLPESVDALAMLRDRKVVGKAVVTMNSYDPQLD